MFTEFLLVLVTLSLREPRCGMLHEIAGDHRVLGGVSYTEVAVAEMKHGLLRCVF